MTVIHLPADHHRHDPLQAVIAAYGPRHVLLAAVWALLRPRRRVRGRDLPAGLRRDVGLAPPPPPLPSQRALW